MQIYMVGGAVRDALLGLPVKDHDWVVVGATPEEMTAQGFLPVGKDFPVFLHPDTKEEYALARTERKTARGYRGFAIHTSPYVTLEEDLARRDLTINSIAVEASLTRADGSFDINKETLTDPFGGRQDVADKVFRHVTLAFREDPVRILRVARLAARFTDFTVAPETMQLMRNMVADGEADHLVAERVWQELSRGLMAQQPSRMFDVLRACGALDRFLPEVNRLWGVPQSAEHHPEIDTGVHLMMVLDMASRLNAPLAVRFACLTHDLGKGELGKLGSDSNFVSAQRADSCEQVSVLTNLESDPNFPRHIGHEERGARLLKGLCERLRVPLECRELADVVAREHGHIHRSAELGAAALVRLMERCDAFRKPRRFEEILLACECDARGRLGLQDTPYPPKDRLLKAFRTVQAVPTHTVAQQAQAKGISGKKIGELIHAARIEALAAAMQAGADAAPA